MTDARLPERYLTDRRLLRLPVDYKWSYVVALLWSVSNRTDGVILADELQYMPGFSDKAPPRLVDAELWRAREQGGWLILDFASTQTSRRQLDTVEKQRRKARERTAIWREKKKAEEAENLDTESDADDPGPNPGPKGGSKGSGDRAGTDAVTRDVTHTERVPNGELPRREIGERKDRPLQTEPTAQREVTEEPAPTPVPVVLPALASVPPSGPCVWCHDDGVDRGCPECGRTPRTDACIVCHQGFVVVPPYSICSEADAPDEAHGRARAEAAGVNYNPKQSRKRGKSA